MERPEMGWEDPAYQITTGPMRLSIKLSDDGYLGRVWIDENSDGRFDMFEVVSNPQPVPSLYLKVIRADDPSDYSPGMWRLKGRVAPYWGRADTIWVTEEAGVARIHSRGRFGRSDHWPYELELTVREGSTTVAVKFNFQYRGDPSVDFISALGAVTGFDYRDRHTFVMRRFAFGGHDRVRQTVVNEAKWNNVARGHLAGNTRRLSASGGGPAESSSYEYGVSPTIEVWDVPMPEWNLVSMIQYTPDYYKIWKAIGEDVGNLPVHFGKQCRGWVDVSDTTRGMAVVLKGMAEQAPKALSVDMGVWDPGAYVRVELWPDQIPPLDLRPVTGSDTGLESEGVKARISESGIERTSEWMIKFHPGDYRTGGVEKEAAAFLGDGSKGGGGR
ncbi:hypothetical protein ACFLT7_05965 [candidate division KSB1 bacterium]